jgi:hypothetical protein
MKRIFAALISLTIAVPAAAEGGPSQIHVLNGECVAPSNTALGPSNEDISKPPYMTPLHCSAAIFAFYNDYHGHVRIDFVQKGPGGGFVLAFGGRVEEEKDGIMMKVDHVYFTTGVSTPVEDSGCRFFQNNEQFKAIVCGTAIDYDNGTRQAAVVNFLVAPGQ